MIELYAVIASDGDIVIHSISAKIIECIQKVEKASGEPWERYHGMGWRVEPIKITRKADQ